MPELLTPDIIGKNEHFLIYGEPGTGKTFCALTAPGPIYVIAPGNTNEMKTAFSKDFREKVGDKEIYFDVAEEKTGDRGQFTDNPTGFDNVCDLLDAALEKDADPDDPFTFKTLVIDNATTLGEFAMNKAIAVEYGLAGGKDKTALVKLRKHGIVKPADSDYGSQQSLIRQFVTHLSRLDKHIVFIAHEWRQTSVDRATREATISDVKPLFYGKQRTEIPGLFDNVWRMQIQSGFFEAQTVGQDSPYPITGKTRMGGVLKKKWRNPNLTEAIEKLQAAAAKD